jgi:lipoyl(octanoyl) transferase
MADLDLALKSAFEDVFGPAVAAPAEPVRKTG